MLIRIPAAWEIPARECTPETAYVNRRQILLSLGILGAQGLRAASPYPPRRNPEFKLDREITDERAATSYNNFYEFDGRDKEAVRHKTGLFITRPWSLEVTGLVHHPKTFDIGDIERTMPLEERLYRHRCVEAWSMAVPWCGFPLAHLLKLASPKSDARFVRFISASRPKEMPGVASQSWYPWPYFEALRIDEAMNPLTLVVTGLYGKPLPKQNGAPIRIVTPWKYGYKSPKSIVKIELVASQPATFWNQLEPREYGFYSNVNPKAAHPRWSQAVERVIPRGDRVATLLYNGYGHYVAAMYKGNEFKEIARYCT